MTDATQPESATRPDTEQADRSSTRPDVSIIIPVYNRLDMTQQCLSALPDASAGTNYEVIFVDNCSTDGTAEYLTRRRGDERLRVLRNETNRGFSSACNQGAAAARAPYLLFLNNDTVPKAGWLDWLQQVVDRDERVGAVGAKLLFPDGTVQHAGVAILDDRLGKNPLAPMHIYYRHSGDYPPANEPRTYQALTAACLLVRRSAFQAVGGFDEGYWNGYEDVDLCFKLQENGWLLVYEPRCVLVHHESQSRPERFSRVKHNTELLHQKWLGRINADLLHTGERELKLAETARLRPYSAPGSAPRTSRPTVVRGMVSIIILTYNQMACTRECLASIRRHTPQPHELILVDNGSTDGTVEFLTRFAAQAENVRLVLNDRNLGFAAGNNQGLALARGEHVLLLNNDTVVTPGWLGRQLTVFQRHPKTGIVGPTSDNVSGPQRIAKPAHAPTKCPDAVAKLLAVQHAGRSTQIPRVVGFCMLVRRSVIDRIGGLDERFGTGNFEDDDYCLRARLAGFEVRIAHDAFIHHVGSQTFKGAGINYRAAFGHNWALFKSKWGFPDDLPLEKGYGMPLGPLPPAALYVAVPNLPTEAGDAPVGAGATPSEWLARADAAVAAGRLVQAGDILREAVTALPDQAPLWSAWGSVSLAQRQFTLAALALRRAVVLAPDDATLRNQLGVAFFHAGDVDAAAGSFLAAASLEPANADILLNLVNAYTQQRRYAQAAEALGKVLAIEEENPDALAALGALGLETDTVDAAQEALARLRVVAPEHPAVAVLAEALAGQDLSPALATVSLPPRV